MAELNGTNDDYESPPQSPSNVASPRSVEPVLEVLDRVEAYQPAIPDNVTENILINSGLNTNDPQMVRLVSLAAQKFISDIAYEALQHCKMRGGGKEQKKKEGRKSEKFTMTLDDLNGSLQEHGIMVQKPPYYAN